MHGHAFCIVINNVVEELQASETSSKNHMNAVDRCNSFYKRKGEMPNNE